MTVTCVADAPVVDDSTGPTGYNENSPAVVVDAGVTVTNADGVAITGGTVGITGNFQSGQDVLDWTDNDLGDTITEGASTNQTVVLTGAGTAAEYQAALRAVTYVNTSDNPSTLSRTVTFSLTTAAGTPTDVIGIAVFAVDDAPVAVDDSATVLEDAAATAVAVLTNDTDVDGGPMSHRLGDPAGQRHRGDHRWRQRADLRAPAPTTATTPRAPPPTPSPTRSTVATPRRSR